MLYQRIMQEREVSREIKDRLRNQYKTLNPAKLKKQIDAILTRLKPTSVR